MFRKGEEETEVRCITRTCFSSLHVAGWSLTVHVDVCAAFMRRTQASALCILPGNVLQSQVLGVEGVKFAVLSV